MELQRTPPNNMSTAALKKPSPPHHGSDSLLYKTDSRFNDSQQLDYVSHRNKRPREDDMSIAQLSSFKDEMKELMISLITEQNKNLTSISSDLQKVKESNSNIESCILLLTSQNEDFQKKISFLEEQSKKDREYICILEEKIEDLQRLSRKTSIELKNVPKKPQESRQDLINMTLNISRNIQLEMNDRDIHDVFRIKNRKKSEKNSSVVVELRSSILRSDFLKKVKEFNYKNKTKIQARHLGFTTNVDQPIFVSEQLTMKGTRLFFLARDLAKSKQYKYCWTAFGKVYVRKDDQSKIILIESEVQVQQLMQEI